MKIILASKSPRRKQLLELMGVKNFEIIVSNTNEVINKSLSIEEVSKQLAYEKAKAVFDRTTGDRIVIGSDTLVVKDEKIDGKPKNAEDAFNMIKELNGGDHKVFTSLSVLKEENGKECTYLDCDIAIVTIKKMTYDEINNWVASGEPMDKAGAYAVQGRFTVYIEKINGNYDSVVGLPTSKLYDVIKEYI